MKRFLWIGIALGVVACGEPTTTSPTAAPESQTEAEPVNDGGVTIEDYNQITAGMTVAEVEAIVGKGTQVNNGQQVEGAPPIVAYEWEGSGEPGADLTVSFQDNQVISKYQFGLGEQAGQALTMAQYEQISAQISQGITLAEVEAILGEGQETGREMGEGTPDTVVYEWYGQDSIQGIRVELEGDTVRNVGHYNLE